MFEHLRGHQCGDYRGHGGSHSLIVATVFAIAAERAGVTP